MTKDDECKLLKNCHHISLKEDPPFHSAVETFGLYCDRDAYYATVVCFIINRKFHLVFPCKVLCSISGFHSEYYYKFLFAIHNSNRISATALTKYKKWGNTYTLFCGRLTTFSEKVLLTMSNDLIIIS